MMSARASENGNLGGGLEGVGEEGIAQAPHVAVGSPCAPRQARFRDEKLLLQGDKRRRLACFGRIRQAVFGGRAVFFNMRVQVKGDAGQPVFLVQFAHVAAVPLRGDKVR